MVDHLPPSSRNMIKRILVKDLLCAHPEMTVKQAISTVERMISKVERVERMRKRTETKEKGL